MHFINHLHKQNTALAPGYGSLLIFQWGCFYNPEELLLRHLLLLTYPQLLIIKNVLKLMHHLIQSH